MGLSEKEKKHITKMTKNDLHEKHKACILSHSDYKKDSACEYPWNGYKVSSTVRKDMYNKELNPGDIDETKLDEDVLKGASSRNPEKLAEFIAKYRNALKKAYESSTDLLKGDPRAWFIGDDSPDPDNFRPKKFREGKGFHHPYYHNWHHLIPNGAIKEYIGSGNDGYKCLFLLMTSKYNIHSQENIVLLPLDAYVGRALGLPIHCPYFLMAHKDYQLTCKRDLDKIKEILQEVLDKKEKPHKLNDETVVRVKKEMEDLSAVLLWVITEMQPGESIDQEI